jgi:hypothetical protein
MGAVALVLAQEAPALIALAKDLFMKNNPGVPPPTSEEILRGFEELFTSSLAVDDMILAAHAND